MAVDVAFDWHLETGRCLAVWVPEEYGLSPPLSGTPLAKEEVAIAAALGPVRRRNYVGGRVAMREAMVRSGMGPAAILSDERGAPVLPRGTSGSISHKDIHGHLTPGLAPVAGIAVALVAREARARVGVDVELEFSRSARAIDIAPRVLAEDEAAELASLDRTARAREVLLRFSAKEALYKALDPFIRRYVGFGEVSVTPLPDGEARVALRLREGEGPFEVALRWRRFEGFVVTNARVDLA